MRLLSYLVSRSRSVHSRTCRRRRRRCHFSVSLMSWMLTRRAETASAVGPLVEDDAPVAAEVRLRGKRREAGPLMGLQGANDLSTYHFAADEHRIASLFSILRPAVTFIRPAAFQGEVKRGTNSFQSHRCSRADGLDGGSAGRQNRSSVGGQEHGRRHAQDHRDFGNRHERRRGPELRSRHRLAAFRDHELHQGHRLRQPGVERAAHAPAGKQSAARRRRHAAARRTAAARRAQRQFRVERAGNDDELRSRRQPSCGSSTSS